jgi:serine/threonine protein kinase
VGQVGGVLQFASAELKADREVVLAAVGQDGRALLYTSAELQGDRDFVLAAVWQTGEALQHASAELKADREVVMAAVVQVGGALRHAAVELHWDRDFVLAAVRQNGGALGYASAELKGDREVVLAAVRQNGRALRHASAELRGDREVVLAAVGQNGGALGYASAELKADAGVLNMGLAAEQIAAAIAMAEEEQTGANMGLAPAAAAAQVRQMGTIGVGSDSDGGDDASSTSSELWGIEPGDIWGDPADIWGDHTINITDLLRERASNNESVMNGQLRDSAVSFSDSDAGASSLDLSYHEAPLTQTVMVAPVTATTSLRARLRGLQGETTSSLDLSNNSIGPDEVATLANAISSIGAIICLNVMKNPIGDDGLAALMTAVKGTNIKSITGIMEGQTSINWSGQDLNPFDMKILAADIEFTPFRAIRGVNLSANKCFGVDKWGNPTVDKDQTGWAAVCGALKGNRTIETLVLTDIGAGPIALSTLADAISDMATINDMILDMNPITGASWNVDLNGYCMGGYEKGDTQMDGFVTFCDAIKPSKVAKLSLAACALGPDAMSTLATALSDIVGIRVLNLASNKCFGMHSEVPKWHATPGDPGYTEDGWNAVCESLKGTAIQKLDISDIGLTPSGLATFSNAMSVMPAMKNVNLSSNKCFGQRKQGWNEEHDVDNDQTGWHAICEAFKGTAIETLVISDIGAGPVALYALADAMSEIASMNSLTVSSTGQMGHHQQKRYTLSGLQGGADPNLDLSSLNLGPADLHLLSTLLASFPNFNIAIKHVNLSSNKCFGPVAIYSRTAVPLAVQNQDNDQTGWHAICQAFKGTAIETLVIYDIGAGPVALSTLADAMSEMATLNSVNVSKNIFGADGGAALVDALRAHRNIEHIMHEDCDISTAAADFLQHLTATNAVANCQDGGAALRLAMLGVNGDVPSELLFWAAEVGHPAVTALLANGDNIPTGAMLATDGQQGMTLAHHCATSGLVTVLDAIGSRLDTLGHGFVDLTDHIGRTVLDVAAGSNSEAAQHWAVTYGTYADRFRLDPGRAGYFSGTSKVYCGNDVLRSGQPRVAVKVMRRREDWLHEQLARRNLGIGPLDPRYVVEILDVLEVDQAERCKREAKHGEVMDDNNPDGECVLSMPLGDRSLNDDIMSGQQAGRSSSFVAMVLWDVCNAVHHLHVERSVVHTDIKPKNICRFGTVHKLIDMDGAARLGEAQAGRKPSPAYTPPESARELFLHDCGDYTGVAREAMPIMARPSFDSWSIGAVAHELLSGIKLFLTDQTDDRVIDQRSLLELVNWRTIGDARLQQILPDCRDEDVRAAAQDLVAQCLQGDPAKRLTMQQILKHRFIELHRAQLPEPEPEPEPEPDVMHHLGLVHKPSEPATMRRQKHKSTKAHKIAMMKRMGEKQLSMCSTGSDAERLEVEPEPEIGSELEPETSSRFWLLQQQSLLAATWHFFLSHMQSEARDLVKDLFSMMDKSGCRAWLDMQAEKINRLGLTRAANRRSHFQSKSNFHGSLHARAGY